jgi:imidazoleglycerol-phosphate dehydratase
VLLHYGGNAHHTIECIFKAFARACDAATKIDPRLGGAVPSTKGTLTT